MAIPTPTPSHAMPGHPPVTSNIYPSLTYADAPAAIEWLCRAFGFRRRMVVPAPDGGVMHSELSLGPGVIMVSSPKPADGRLPPRDLEVQGQGLCVHVADPDAHCARALAAGAVLVRALQDEHYGARGYMVRDIGGHLWYFGNYVPGEYWDQAAG